jgi:1-acyl-sn-glycerol-3-phosphate acyltransferase
LLIPSVPLTTGKRYCHVARDHHFRLLVVNRQPFQTPPRSWPPRMTPWLVRLWRPLVVRDLSRGQRIVELDIGGIEHVQRALKDGAGVLVTPNHSFHYDSYVVIEASHRVGMPFHYLTAWQVFAMSKWHERLMLQWHGCFSINREGADMAAFKTAVEILRTSPHPLVIFPEGDIYHNNDRVTPFRDGAAAIAMTAAKKAERPIVCVPCALKCFYLDDPTPRLLELMSRLEETIHWRPRPDLPLDQRVYRFAEGMLALKELEFVGQAQCGPLQERTSRLADAVLARLEQRHQVPNKRGIIPERVKEVRRTVIKAIEQDGQSTGAKEQLAADMDDLFFVVQLYSYPGNYVAEQPTIERIAETLDKFEEDVLRAEYPAVRGTRRTVLRFGEPIPVPKEREAKGSVEQWTDLVESRVQGLLDDINRTAQRTDQV